MESSVLNKAAEWEALINQLPGIFGAHVVFSDDGSAEEIHVLAGLQKNCKSLSRDIQSALAAKFGANIDYQVISIAQIDEEMSLQRGRLALRGLTVRNQEGKLHVEVTLGRDKTLHVGAQEGRNTPIGRRRCIAQAALDAVGQEIQGQPLFELVSVDKVGLSGGRQVLLAQVYSVEDRLTLLGSAYTEEDEDAAAARCVLNAINRKIGMI